MVNSANVNETALKVSAASSGWVLGRLESRENNGTGIEMSPIDRRDDRGRGRAQTVVLHLPAE